jgi:predicted alpha/beta hydrolase family esterase
MTTQVLFIQGGGANVHDGWDRKLVDSLARELGPGYHVRYPRMPQEDDPTYAAWAPAIRRALDALDDGAIVVGHSIGGTILIHALAEQAPRARLGGLILIAAPFVGEGGWPSDEIAARADFGARVATKVILCHGTADDTVPTAHVHLYARALPGATVRVLADRDHQLNDDLGDVAGEIRARLG